MHSVAFLLTAAAAAVTLATSGRVPVPPWQTTDHWPKHARSKLLEAEKVWQQLRYEAKSAILFIGDGMGPSTVTAGRIVKGQLAGASGEEFELEMDTLPHSGLIKTYSADGQTADSASTATAFLCGVKTRDGVVGLNQNAQNKVCSSYRPREHDLESILLQAQRQGKSVGIVTTTRLTHATPAAGYANSVSRSWECDSDRDTDANSETPEQKAACSDIATQLVDKAINFTVLLGGGRLKMIPKTNWTIDHANGNMSVRGERSDGVNLISEWRRRQAAFNRSARYVETADQLRSVDTDTTDRLLGLLALSHMRYHIENQASEQYKEPTLSEMLQVALKMLMRNENGFVLLVEGGRIDHGHHGNQAQRALHDLVAMDDAVGTAKRMTSQNDTLLIVTADHSHVFTLGHYGKRGQPVLERMFSSENDSQFALASDGKAYTPVNYADGPSARKSSARRNIINDTILSNPQYRYQSLVSKSSESHGGEDVAIFASGPGAQLFNSVQEQSYIAHAVMKAACIGWYKESGQCLRSVGNAAGTVTASAGAVVVVVVFVVAAVAGLR